jgi:hypothetical protein
MPVVAQRYEPDADLSALRDHPQNPRRGDDASVADSIDRNGWYGAIIAQQGTGRILAGHTRRRVLNAQGAKTGPVLWVECDDETAQSILLADNRTAELASWDEDSLLDLLKSTPADLLIGFDADDVDVLQRLSDARNVDRYDSKTAYADEWTAAGMPAAEADQDLRHVYQTTVQFRTDEDAASFFEAIDKPKTRRFWWPDHDGFIGRDLGVAVVAGAE